MTSAARSALSPVTADTVVYLISGANRGLGLGLVQHLAPRPNTIIFAGTRNPATSQQLHTLSTTHPNIHILQLTANSNDDNRAAATAIADMAGRLDVLIANAAYQATLHEQTIQTSTSYVNDWRSIRSHPYNCTKLPISYY